MKIEMTPEEHARLHRRRGRQALGLVIAVLVLIGVLTVLHAGVNAVAKLFDDTAQKQEYEDKLEGLVLFDPVPFEGIENIDDLTLREAAVWGCVYSIQETQGGFDGYNTDPDTEQLLIPSVDVDAYLAKLVGPSFRMTHKTFEMEDMTIEFDDTTQCYKIPVTGSVGSYRATVTKLFKKDGLLHVTVGYIPNQNATDSILTTTSDTPVKYMDYLFSRQSGSWYLTGLTESETKPESTAASCHDGRQRGAGRHPRHRRRNARWLRRRVLGGRSRRRGSGQHRRKRSRLGRRAAGRKCGQRGGVKRITNKNREAPRASRFLHIRNYFKSNRTTTSRYQRYGTMFHIIHNSIRT